MTPAGTDRRDRGPRVALVTGGATGIGRACVELLSGRGYTVAIDHLGNKEAATALAEQVDGLEIEVDVADPVAVREMISTIESGLGPVELAVCNAGFAEEVPLEDLNDEMWDRMLKVLLGGCVNVVGALAPVMIERRRGSIVTISSELAIVGAVEQAHYVAAKAAIVGFSRSVAKELAVHGIRVNIVAPGPTDTALLTERWRTEDYLAQIPLGRLGRPEEVAEVVVAVAEASYLTGQLISPNGGVVMQ